MYAADTRCARSANSTRPQGRSADARHANSRRLKVSSNPPSPKHNRLSTRTRWAPRLPKASTKAADHAATFQQEYERLNWVVYDGALPAFPGVELVDRTDIFSMTRTRGRGEWRVLRPFLLSRHLSGQLLMEAIRHEVAHAAALLFDEDEDHGPAWQEHARRCGARQIATLDDGDPLRRDWPQP
jgi:hypothetical protein